MIESIQFKNFKALRDATLPLGPCTILVGPNGSGKSTVLQALEAVRQTQRAAAFQGIITGAGRPIAAVFAQGLDRFASVGSSKTGKPEVRLNWARRPGTVINYQVEQAIIQQISVTVNGIRVFSLDAAAIAVPAPVKDVELAHNGAGLAAVLDALRDNAPERFDAINAELGRWLPEFDSILFDRPSEGNKSIALRTRIGQYKIPARDLSQGTLIALALLTLAYLPQPPSVVGLEEPDRGMHPHLLRNVQSAIYRLAYPENYSEKREPVQVIATTHSPYFLDLFKDHPEEIVVANKVDGNIRFQRLTDQPNFQEVFAGAALGEVWYSGLLGGVPAHHEGRRIQRVSSRRSGHSHYSQGLLRTGISITPCPRLRTWLAGNSCQPPDSPEAPPFPDRRGRDHCCPRFRQEPCAPGGA